VPWATLLSEHKGERGETVTSGSLLTPDKAVQRLQRRLNYLERTYRSAVPRENVRATSQRQIVTVVVTLAVLGVVYYLSTKDTPFYLYLLAIVGGLVALGIVRFLFSWRRGVSDTYLPPEYEERREELVAKIEACRRLMQDPEGKCQFSQRK
jgi:hypothetical protein